MRRSLTCLLFLLLAGCLGGPKIQSGPVPSIPGITRHEIQSLQRYIGKPWFKPRTVGIGFVWEEERNVPPAERSSTEDIHLKQGQAFDPYLILNAPEETTVLVSTLLDYKQIEFELNGKTSLLHEITVEPGGDLELPVHIDIRGEGMHDLIVIAFADPYNASLDPQYRSSMDSRMVGRRTVIMVGNNTAPARILDPALLGQPVPKNVTFGLGAAFATSSKHGHPSDVDRQLYIANVDPGTLFDYEIWLSNVDGKRTSEYLLMAFLDYHQVFIHEKDSLLIKLNPNEESIIDASAKIPDGPGVHQMQLVYVFDPYKSIADDEVEAPFVFGSPRIALHAQP